jgi:hypothetical protein
VIAFDGDAGEKLATRPIADTIAREDAEGPTESVKRQRGPVTKRAESKHGNEAKRQDIEREFAKARCTTTGERALAERP